MSPRYADLVAHLLRVCRIDPYLPTTALAERLCWSHHQLRHAQRRAVEQRLLWCYCPKGSNAHMACRRVTEKGEQFLKETAK